VNAGDAIVRLESISRAFGAVVALDEMSLNVERGEIFGIIGKSGAGKSTLIRTINGLERIDTGRIIVDGSDLATLDDAGLNRVRRKVGMIFQHFNLLSMKNQRFETDIMVGVIVVLIVIVSAVQIGGDLDANAFQHRPFLENQIKSRGYHIVAIADTIVEPIGLYSLKVKNVGSLPEGTSIGIPNDPSNGGRGLLLLQQQGLNQLRAAGPAHSAEGCHRHRK